MHKLHMAWDRIARIEGGTARPISPATPPRPLHIPHRPLRWARRNVLPKARVSLQAPSMRTLSVFLSCAALACVSEHGPLTNRMAQSATHYLTRAARQPVSWQPWGREAFALAARLDRPVLLYVGADECRWCAVMDREVYGDPALGAMIDSLFVPVRVDRDERPDVARRYEAAVQWLAGLRGYPVTAFLTPDGSAFFGGTYFPADDPVTGRGLKQLLPEVAKSYRERRAFIVQHAALVRELTRTRDAQARSVLRPAAIEAEVNAVRGSLRLAVASRGALGSFTHTQAVSLMLVTYRRTGDSSYLDAARAALDLMVDFADSTGADGARDEPPTLVRAGLVRALAPAWALTGEARYGAALLALLNRLTRDVGRTTFADQEAYVIGSVLNGPPGLGASAATRALSALDALLRRAYAPGRGVRRSEEHTSELQSPFLISYAVFCLKKKKKKKLPTITTITYTTMQTIT